MITKNHSQENSFRNNFVSEGILQHVARNKHERASPIATVLRNMKSIEPEALQSGFGVYFLFGPANFSEIAGEILSDFSLRNFPANVLPFFLQGFRPPKKITPNTHAQNCLNSSRIWLFRTKNCWVTLLVGIEMSFSRYRDFSVFFLVSRSSLTSNLQDVEAQKDAQVDPRKKMI